MSAETEMTIVVRARDATKGVLAAIGTGITKVLGAPLKIVGNLVESVYRRFFSLRALLVGGGFIAVFSRVLGSITSPSATKFEAFFSPEQQKRIDLVASSWSALGATIQKVFGDVIATHASEIQKVLLSVSVWFVDHKDDIVNFFAAVGQGVEKLISGLSKAVNMMYLLGLLLKASFQYAAGSGMLGSAFKPDKKARDDEERDVANEQGFASPNQQAAFDDYRKRVADQIKAQKDLREAIAGQELPLARYLVQLQEIADVFANDLTNGILGFVQGTLTAAQAVKSMVSSMLADLGRLFVSRGFQAIFGQLLGVAGLGPILGLAGNNPTGYGMLGHVIPGRAAGGPVSRGRGYMVGENGPEYFQPNSDGRIIPNGSGGGMVIHNHFPQGTDPRQIEAILGRLLQSKVGTRMQVRRA